MNFLQTSEPINGGDITNIERTLGLQFPDDFKEHYLTYNGGYPENDSFVWPDGGIIRVNSFSSMKHEGYVSLEDTYNRLVLFESYLPACIVPFAFDDGGNMYCVSCRDTDYGVIYYCNNDYYNEENENEYLAIVSSSFRNFINNLKAEM